LRIHRIRTVTCASALIAAAAWCLAPPGVSGAHPVAAVTASTCTKHPWTSASYQAASTPPALAALVVSCLEKRYPTTYLDDEVGVVALEASPPLLQNINELAPGSDVEAQLASLGIPPITLEDGPGGLITESHPLPTQLPNELALGATFDPSMATSYGNVLGTQAHAMGYDGVQAPDLNLLRVETWGRAMESFGESPVLAGELGGAEAVAIEADDEIPILKHFSPYSQETNRQVLDQTVSAKALQELYIRPFTFVLRAVTPQLEAGGHAVGVMCSYGGVNGIKACRSHLLTDELDYVGVNALVRSDLNVKVDPSALVLNGVDLIKPLQSSELLSALKDHAVERALTRNVTEIFETEFADGLVTGQDLTAAVHPPPSSVVDAGNATALAIEQRAAVLLKNTGVLPIDHTGTAMTILADSTLPESCRKLASSMSAAQSVHATCVDDARAEPSTVLLSGLPHAEGLTTRVATFNAPAPGPYVVTVTTLGNTELRLNGSTILDSQGLAEFEVARTALVDLTSRERAHFELIWKGAPPIVSIAPAQSQVDAAVAAVHGAKLAIVLACDLDREGMDRSSLQLPGAQDAVIAAVAAKVPTVVVLATDGAVTMPWLSKVDAVLEVWNPTGAVRTDAVESLFVPAWTKLLDGTADPSGRLPETFPVSMRQSPAGVRQFWPGTDESVDLDEPPDNGVAIGMAWYRHEHWPVLFPFGYGLSYTSYALQGGTVQSSSSGLSMTVSVADTGQDAGSEPVQVYADWPNPAGEPDLQLVGFGVATFSAKEASTHAAQQVTIPLSPDAFTVDKNGAMQLVSGSYCLEAATFDGDPKAWSTGPITLSPNTAGSALNATGSVALTQSTCPS
jgi:beta-glucosidase